MRTGSVLRVTVVTALTAVAVALTAAPALAGGAALDFDQEWYQPGDVAHGSTFVTFLDWEGWLDDGPFSAYLEPIPDPTEIDTDGARIDPDAIPLGPFHVESRSPASALVSIDFTVPDVPAGGYSVTYCNDPCTAWLGDLVGGWLWIGTATPEQARAVAPRTEAIADHDRGNTDWVPWVGATALVLVLAVTAGVLHLAARRRAA